MFDHVRVFGFVFVSELLPLCILGPYIVGVSLFLSSIESRSIVFLFGLCFGIF